MSALEYFKTLKIVIGVPSMGEWHEKFAISLTNMLTYCQFNNIGKFKTHEIQVCSVRGSILSNERVDVLKRAREVAATHVLWIDSDQKFPRNTIHRLISHNKDVVGANIATKQIPAGPTARKFEAGNPKGGLVYTDENSHGLEKVWRLGCGVMLVRGSVYRKTGLNVFGLKWVEEAEKYQGEDWSMCEAFEQHGFEVYVDHDLSNEIGHIGEYVYTHDVVGTIGQAEAPLVGAAHA